MWKSIYLLLAVLAYAMVLAAPAAWAGEVEKRFDVAVGASPAKGPANAPVTMIEFLDYT